jgi:dinuclear metal center YbgI/SA1388 family protein
MPTPTITEVVAELATIAPFDKAAAWDPVGLQLGDASAGVDRMAVCHEVTEEVVKRMESDPVDLLVSYHPLLFEPSKRFVAGRSASGRAFRLVRDGVALGVVHTAFDVAEGGTADALAAVLGLGETTGFGPLWAQPASKVITFVPADAVDLVAAAMAAAGAGRIGNYSGCSFRSEGLGTFFAGEGTKPAAGARGEMNAEPEMKLEMVTADSSLDGVVGAMAASHPYEEPAFDVIAVRANAGFVGRIGRLPAPVSLDDFTGVVTTALGGVVRQARANRDAVRTVAVVPGSGSGFIAAASSAADVIVTGDVGHHAAREAITRGISVVDPGHAPTERPGVSALYAAVSALGPDAEHLSEMDGGPWEEPA